MGMRFITRSKSSNNEGWGMGFLLVFFPEEEDHHHQHEPNNNNNDSISRKKPNNFNLFSSPLKRTNSAHLLHRAQSTISICLLLLFTTLLLFTLSTLPSSATTSAARRLHGPPRRHLQEFSSSAPNLPHALQGMGTLYRRGTRAMSELVVAHGGESLSQQELRLFLRLFYRSSLASRSDLLLIFPAKTAAVDGAILRETDSFSRLLTQYGWQLGNKSGSPVSFDVTQFVKQSKKEGERGEPIWGRRIRANYSEEGGAESTRPSYGSVVGFDVDELDPENSLSGFLDHVPMSLRRWACYPMLLGRVRRNFKHVMLVDAKEMLLLGDPLARVRSHSPESVFVKAATQSPSQGKHGRKNSIKTQPTQQKPVHPGIVMGGSRGVRRVSNAMLMNIVRAPAQHKKKSSVTESSLFNQLVGNDFVLKNVNLMVSSEPIPEPSSFSDSSLGSSLFGKNYGVIRRGNSNLEVNSMVMKHICSFPIDSRVYSDCL